jgi:hypothetical protein
MSTSVTDTSPSVSRSKKAGLLASFEHLDTTVDTIKQLRAAGIKGITAYAPFPEHQIEEALGYKESPVRVFTFVGALTGAAAGFAFTIFSVQDWPLIVGGKPLLSIPAFVVIAFEMTILFGALSTVIGLFILARIPKFQPHVVYDPEYSSGRFGLYVDAPEGKEAEARKILTAANPIELQGGTESANA